ncbi:hypothetical protein [Neobacillus muris]|uniref:hypothetical protein n=1 Tax=Neobacillus muris TaxID=2941334 RepID=UPI002040CAE8|nr:hypothetical protein [Neobacillus muris]
MSVDVTIMLDYYIDKKEIEEIIYSLGFQRTEYENTFFWYDKSFISTRGCWFSYTFDEDVQINGTTKNCKTICCTNTKSGRSYDDFQKQLDTIKEIEKRYGGVVYSDDELGYFENDLPRLSRTEIACGFVYVTYQTNLIMVKELIEDVDLDKIKGLRELGVPPFFQKNFLRNNVLLPFFVSILENFLKSFLYGYIQTNEEAQNKIYKKKANISYSVVKEIIDGQKNIIDIEIAEYSFQNFNSANRAYKEYANIDLFKDILIGELSLKGEERKLISVLQEMIDSRHKLIHEANLNYELDKKMMELYYQALELLGSNIVRFLKEKRNVSIDLEEVL